MRIFLFSAVLTAIFLLPACSSAAEGPPAYAVWAKPQPDQRTTLHYAAKHGGKWDEPKELAVEPGKHFTPVIAADRKGAVWIVWTEQKEKENILRYAVLRGGKTETGRVLREKNGGKKEQSYAPAIVIDPQDVPWIAWSGVTEGQMADIYVSSWLGGGWTEPTRAHEPNQTPDITPILGLRGGKDLWLSWFGISPEQGTYVRYSAELRGGGKWTAAGGPDPAEDVAAFISQRSRVEPFPEQAGQWLTGAFFAGLDCEIQSVSEHFASFKQEGGGK